MTGGVSAVKKHVEVHLRQLYMLLYLTLDITEEDPSESVIHKSLTLFPLIIVQFYLTLHPDLIFPTTSLVFEHNQMLLLMAIVSSVMCYLLQDILYRFPAHEDDTKYMYSEQELLLQLKGVFLTLSDVMRTITKSSSSWLV